MYLERRALPKSNKITYKRYVDKCQQLHRDRLKKIKSTLDNKPPKKHKHLRRNLKREQMMEGTSLLSATRRGCSQLAAVPARLRSRLSVVGGLAWSLWPDNPLCGWMYRAVCHHRAREPDIVVEDVGNHAEEHAGQQEQVHQVQSQPQQGIPAARAAANHE